MKQLISILIVIPFLFSFSNNRKGEASAMVAGTITLDDLPQRWVLILEDKHMGDGFYIERWCDIGATNFQFQVNNEDSCTIYFHYGGDDEFRSMYNFKAWEVVDDEEKLIKGTFQYDPIDTWKSKREVNFWWDEEKRLAHFEGLLFSRAYFAPWEDKEKYKTIEDCNGGNWEKWE